MQRRIGCGGLQKKVFWAQRAAFWLATLLSNSCFMMRPVATPAPTKMATEADGEAGAVVVGIER